MSRAWAQWGHLELALEREPLPFRRVAVDVGTTEPAPAVLLEWWANIGVQQPDRLGEATDRPIAEHGCVPTSGASGCHLSCSA